MIREEKETSAIVVPFFLLGALCIWSFRSGSDPTVDRVDGQHPTLWFLLAGFRQDLAPFFRISRDPRRLVGQNWYRSTGAFQGGEIVLSLWQLENLGFHMVEDWLPSMVADHLS